MITEEKLADKLIEGERAVLAFLRSADTYIKEFEEDLLALNSWVLLVETERINPSDYPKLRATLRELYALIGKGLVSEKEYNSLYNKLSKNSVNITDFITLYVKMSTLIYLRQITDGSVEVLKEVEMKSFRAITPRGYVPEHDFYYKGGDERTINEVLEDNYLFAFIIGSMHIKQTLRTKVKDVIFLKAKIRQFKNRIRNNLITGCNWAFNNATMLAMEELKVQRYTFSAILDGRTSKICRSMHGSVFKVKTAEVGVNFPPMHHGCRSVAIPNLL